MKNGVFWIVTPCGSCKNPEDTILQSFSLSNCRNFHIFYLKMFGGTSSASKLAD
jgi:hypothetical protein